MAEGDTPYRFKNGQWEVWDEGDWGPANTISATILRGYTKVKDIGQRRFVFFAEDGGFMTEEAFFNLIEQVHEADRLKYAPWWGPEITAMFGPYPPKDGATAARALNYAQDLRIPGTPGVTTPTGPAPTLIFGSKAEAEAEVAANGGVMVRRRDGRWGVEDRPVEQGGQDEQYVPGETFGLPQGSLIKVDNLGKLSNYIAPPDVMQSGGIVRGESIGGPPGTWFIRQPNGIYTPYTPPEAAPTGDFMTRAQAADFVRGFAETPEEASRWIDALTGRGRDVAAAQGRAPIPTESLGEFARALSVDAEGNAIQFRDAQGNPIQNPFAAALAARPFPGAPPGAGGLETPAGQGPFTSARTVEEFEPEFAYASPEAQAAIQAEFERRRQTTQSQGLTGTGFADAIQSDLQALTARQEQTFQTALAPTTGGNILTPGFNQQAQEEWEAMGGVGPAPVFQAAPAGGQPGAYPEPHPSTQAFWATLSPERQALSASNWEKRKAQFEATGNVRAPAFASNIGGVLRQAQAGDVAGARMNAQGLVQQGFEARMRSEPPFDISGFLPETQAAIRAGTAGVTSPGQGFFRAGAFSPETPAAEPQPQPQDSFTRALAEITQRQKQYQFLGTRRKTTRFS